MYRSNNYNIKLDSFTTSTDDGDPITGNSSARWAGTYLTEAGTGAGNIAAGQLLSYSDVEAEYVEDLIDKYVTLTFPMENIGVTKQTYIQIPLYRLAISDPDNVVEVTPHSIVPPSHIGGLHVLLPHNQLSDINCFINNNRWKR